MDKKTKQIVAKELIKVAKDLMAVSLLKRLDDLMSDILYEVEDFNENEQDAQDDLHEIIWKVDEALKLIRPYRNGVKIGAFLKSLRKELDGIWQDLENDKPTTSGKAKRVMKKLDDVYSDFTSVID